MRYTILSSRALLTVLFVHAPIFYVVVAAGTAVCYYPNGDIASTYQPCNSTSDGSPSACCELSSSACSLTGFCYGNAGVMYRGGCTDASFSAVQCPHRCTDVNSGSFSNINLCPGSNGNGFFTCSGSGEFTIDMCQTNFTFNAGTPFTPSSVPASQATTTVTTTTTPSATPSATPSTTLFASSIANSSATGLAAQVTCYDPALTVGLAVGIPLGLLAGFLATVIFWQHRKHTSTSSRPQFVAGPFVPSAPSQGYSPSPYSTASSGTMVGTETSISQQPHYPQYYPHPQQQQQQQQQWKLQSSPAIAELQSVDRRHEL